MPYPAYVTDVMYGLLKYSAFGSGFSYSLVHPALHFQISFVEQAIHEITHAVLLWSDAEFGQLQGTDIDKSSRINRALNRRSDKPRQECITLAAEYWILKHWGFGGLDDWLVGVVSHQPASVTVQRVMHHLTHPAKRSYTLRQAHRAMRLIRQSVQNWRRHERGSDQGT